MSLVAIPHVLDVSKSDYVWSTSLPTGQAGTRFSLNYRFRRVGSA